MRPRVRLRCVLPLPPAVTGGGKYLSSSTPTAVFAADPDEGPHTLTVEWPDNTRSVIDSVRANRIYDVEQPASPSADAPPDTSSPAPPDRTDPFFEDGTAGPRREVCAGGGYWSQRSPQQVLGHSVPVEAVEVRWFDGRVDTMQVAEGTTTHSIPYPDRPQ